MATKHMVMAVGIVTAILIISFVIVNAFLFQDGLSNTDMREGVAQQLETIYAPQINPSEFTSAITNPYFKFAPGKVYVYEGKTEEGIERVEVKVTTEKKTVMGIPMFIVRDKEFLNGELIEDTRDWFAQDREGNVWYFGENTMELVDGKISSRAGSWEAGINGALPGIIMKSSPKIGETYRQEYYKGEAEDMGTVIALGLQINGPYGSFSNCVQIKDWTPLEPGNEEYKYYCSEIGALVYETHLEDGEGVQLIDIGKAATQSTLNEAPREELQADITEQQAKEIALRRVPGKVTDVETEKKFGKITYVVEIDADNGPETDVVIDIQTGKVLDVET